MNGLGYEAHPDYQNYYEYSSNYPSQYSDYGLEDYSMSNDYSMYSYENYFGGPAGAGGPGGPGGFGSSFGSDQGMMYTNNDHDYQDNVIGVDDFLGAAPVQSSVHSNQTS